MLSTDMLYLYAFVCFLQADLPRDMCGSSFIMHRTFVIVLGDTFPCSLPFESTHSLSDGTGCKWLFFLILYQLSYTALLKLSIEMSPSESGWSINSIILSLFSFCCVLSAAVSVETNINRILLN